MGVPELLKFVAKAPNALSRLRHQGAVSEFDYVMIDGTNVMQTVGVDAVITFLSSPSIVVKESVFVLLDSQRDRTGTAREQRSHLSSHALDVGTQQLCSAVSECMKQRSVPVYLSGRDVEGEADYKLLHLQRGLATAAKAQNKVIPKFLFISEDSDVLAGALCGPSPHSCWIATRLRDATHELCLLSVEAASLWLTGVSKDDIQKASDPVEVEVPASDDIATPQNQPDEEVFESRHKKQGPMVGMGTATYFADSDDENDTPNISAGGLAPKETIESVTPSTNEPSQHQKERARRQQSAAVDLILLFLLLKGSGYLAPVIKGATKVDMSSIWSSYMNLGRSIVAFEGNAIRFDGAGLAKILQSSHLFDNMSRPANTEEINCARKYLVAVAKTLLRGIVAFRGPRGSAELLDGRSDQIVEPPTLAAFYALLESDQTRVQMSTVFPPSVKTIANPIEESMMCLSGHQSRPTPAPHALPSIKVGVVQQLASATLSAILELFLSITLRHVLASTPTPKPSTSSGSTFSFDLRRMVGSDNPVPRNESRNAVLAAAGLSTGYSYAIDPARVMARLRPNLKQPVAADAVGETGVVTQPTVPSTQTETVQQKKDAVKQEGIPRVRLPAKKIVQTKMTKAVDNAASGARKCKRRLGKKERVLLAKKKGTSADKK